MSHVTRKWLKDLKLSGRNNLDAYILATKGLEFYLENRIWEKSLSDLAYDPEFQEIMKAFHEAQKFRRALAIASDQ